MRIASAILIFFSLNSLASSPKCDMALLSDANEVLENDNFARQLTDTLSFRMASDANKRLFNFLETWLFDDVSASVYDFKEREQLSHSNVLIGNRHGHPGHFLTLIDFILKTKVTFVFVEGCVGPIPFAEYLCLSLMEIGTTQRLFDVDDWKDFLNDFNVNLSNDDFDLPTEFVGWDDADILARQRHTGDSAEFNLLRNRKMQEVISRYQLSCPRPDGVLVVVAGAEHLPLFHTEQRRAREGEKRRESTEPVKNMIDDHFFQQILLPDTI